MSTSKTDLQPLLDLIDHSYDGNPAQLAVFMDQAVYLLHFVPVEQEFTPLQRQNVCGALFGLKQSLLEANFKQNGWSYKKPR
ncbi:MAG: hypothetical protein A3D31_06145 [Candidatus Fluviicola riflensis]|nr:MAG: hypothetical protein CHH17_08870 [Candidatus Fluviicola riflensis]OGS79544.1 MAG: hypothetical protein A3D31_06145 [Candidatus Fluviicola riflensis]OGS86975.1 MAG: hypothetical protein A2724_05605 [Fluviicola sp. RIFCSPHIGHO2_01_FULL_43_53]OGS89766.1 MAG: hypothetical protein A3E30_02350 [Fluviicola sp. RIFCSPHIGHO2_12_FULL_43_24]